MTKQDLNKLLRFFRDSSLRDLATYKVLKKMRRFDAALFFLHLAIEKNIIALIVKQTKQHPPQTHDLVFLVARAELDPNEEWISWLRTISTFNISTRYEDERFEFYKKMDAKFCQLWDKRAGLILKWIEEKLDGN